MYLYECKRTAILCGSCLVAKAQYKCGWCVNTSSCSVSDGCPSESWVHPSGECPGIPKIESVCLILVLLSYSVIECFQVETVAAPSKLFSLWRLSKVL